MIVGWGNSGKTLGLGPERDCDRCNNRSSWVVVENSKKVRLYFVPVAKWNAEYFMACPVCKNAVELGSREQAQAVVAAVSRGDEIPAALKSA